MQSTHGNLKFTGREEGIRLVKNFRVIKIKKKSFYLLLKCVYSLHLKYKEN